jgi:hypothetical protein
MDVCEGGIAVDKNGEAIKYIQTQVWSGFYLQDEIVEVVREVVFDPDPMNEDWVRGRIQEEFQAKKEAEATWPNVTDCDRLDLVFTEIENQNILVLENAGYTLSDGRSDVTEAWYSLGAEDSDIVGYCYYHGQDLDGVMASGNLYLAFGDILGTDEKGLEVGRMIVREFRALGFTVEWDESINTRILIKRIKWQKRTDRDSYEDD